MIRKLLELIFFKKPVGRTLSERYPARPGVFTTSYSSIELTEEWFVKEPRNYKKEKE